MYRAPLKDIQFALNRVVGSDVLAPCPAYAEYSTETAQAILAEAGRFAESVLDPLYTSADREGARWTPDGVLTPSGFKNAYSGYVEGGWPQLRGPTAYGGQGSPTLLLTAVDELFTAANVAFRLCPLLTTGAIEALTQCGSDEQKATFLPPMISGQWTGTMNLTEPQAGSDLGLLRTRAVADGAHYRVYGQKIFITYGEHDLAENIVHMVLARIDGAPAGVKGISLFIVPKFLVNEDGSLGERNDVHCVSIEHKMGIQGSPTCTMLYGQKDGAIGYLLGEPHHGLEYMFIMMNAARLGVGIEGYAGASRAYQRALDWARNRVQGKPPGPPVPTPLPIAYHPDVYRMLVTMKSQIEAMRYLALYTAAQLDLGHHHHDAAQRQVALARSDLLIPVVKGWSTETGLELCSVGIQIHGGMGFIEATGAAQSLRDARISTIYEGTTGIQAADLIGRKLFRDKGQALSALLADIRLELAAETTSDAKLQAVVAATLENVTRLERVAKTLIELMSTNPALGSAVSVHFLKLTGLTLGAWLMSLAAQRAHEDIQSVASDSEDYGFLEAKIQTAQFFAAQILPQTLGLEQIICHGAAAVIDNNPALL